MTRLKNLRFERATGRATKFFVKYGTIIGMVVALLIIGIRSPRFFAIDNVFDILKQGSTLTLIAVAQTIVLASGAFDMSAGAVLQFASNVAAGSIILGYNPFLVILLCLTLGLLVGFVNTLLVNKLSIPPFVATLSVMFILMGVSLLYNQGEALTFSSQPLFSFLGQGYVGPVPFIFIIVVVLLFFINLLLKNTKVGLHIYAVGGNPLAAHMKGIASEKCLFVAFLLAGAVLGLTGVLQASYNFGASALNTGMDVLISALAAALLGSTFSKTGELSIFGTAFAAMFIAALSNGLIINGVSNLVINGTLGVILVVSVLPTVIHKRDIGQVTIF